jgi:hypothetical protein
MLLRAKGNCYDFLCTLFWKISGAGKVWMSCGLCARSGLELYAVKTGKQEGLGVLWP